MNSDEKKLEPINDTLNPRPNRFGMPWYVILGILSLFLESVWFPVRVAETGAGAIKAFSAWQPNFIWMDWRLPDLDGLEVTRRIRALDGGRDVKIAILSAFAFTEYLREAVAAGVDDFVTKPFHPADIFDCLARHVGVRYRFQEAINETPVALVWNEALASLPAEFRKELTDAINLLDAARIADIIGRIANENAALGRALTGYAETYTYSPILEALQALEDMRPEEPRLIFFPDC